MPLLAEIRRPFPWLRRVFADGGYAGAKLQTALAAHGRWSLEIVKRSDAAKGFEPLIETAVAWFMLASVKPLSCRLTRE